MKKLIFILIVAIFMIAPGERWSGPSQARADGTVTVTSAYAPAGGVTKVTFSWIANAAGAATIPATSSSTEWPVTGRNVGCIAFVDTNPGSTAPTDNYDITLTNADGLDIMGGSLANRDTADTERAAPLIGTFAGCVAETSAFTLNITNNSVNSADGTVIVSIVEF